jgi:hypothetical protein
MKVARLLVAVPLALAGCDDMSVQPKQKAYSPLVGPAQVPPGTVEYNEKPFSEASLRRLRTTSSDCARPQCSTFMT